VSRNVEIARGNDRTLRASRKVDHRGVPSVVVSIVERGFSLCALTLSLTEARRALRALESILDEASPKPTRRPCMRTSHVEAPRAPGVPRGTTSPR
jgi:hypothetical protein